MIIACIGGCGSGKTHKLRNIVGGSLESRAGWRFLVLDLNSEWPGAAWQSKLRRTTAIVSHIGQVRRALTLGRWLVIYRPPLTAGAHDTVRPWADEANALASIAIECRAPVAVVLPEAHTSIREGYPLPPALSTIIHRYRHPSVRAALLFDSQHFADIKKEALKDARHLYLFATGSPEDLTAIGKYGGPWRRQLQEAVIECGKRAAKGEPGWHVRLELLSIHPPFVPRKDPH